MRHASFAHAFQPIVDVVEQTVFAHEALIRGSDGAGALSVLSGLDKPALHALDRESCLIAIASAARLEMQGHLSINALPDSVDGAAHATAIHQTCLTTGFPISKIILEVTENEAIADVERFIEAVSSYRRLSVQIAIDDFGAGHSGLNLLADFQPDLLKLDMNLVRNIESRGPRQAIVRAILQVCEDLGIEVIAEGIESESEFAWFVDHNVRLFQGYLFARAGFDSLPPVRFPEQSTARRTEFFAR
ncbi:MAG: EAL domain-containing protein [Gemmatimonadaceae bacterium]